MNIPAGTRNIVTICYILDTDTGAQLLNSLLIVINYYLLILTSASDLVRFNKSFTFGDGTYKFFDGNLLLSLNLYNGNC